MRTFWVPTDILTYIEDATEPKLYPNKYTALVMKESCSDTENKLNEARAILYRVATSGHIEKIMPELFKYTQEFLEIGVHGARVCPICKKTFPKFASGTDYCHCTRVRRQECKY